MSLDSPASKTSRRRHTHTPEKRRDWQNFGSKCPLSLILWVLRFAVTPREKLQNSSRNPVFSHSARSTKLGQPHCERHQRKEEAHKKQMSWGIFHYKRERKRKQSTRNKHVPNHLLLAFWFLSIVSLKDFLDLLSASLQPENITHINVCFPKFLARKITF